MIKHEIFNNQDLEYVLDGLMVAQMDGDKSYWKLQRDDLDFCLRHYPFNKDAFNARYERIVSFTMDFEGDIYLIISGVVYLLTVGTLGGFNLEPCGEEVSGYLLKADTNKLIRLIRGNRITYSCFEHGDERLFMELFSGEQLYFSSVDGIMTLTVQL